jgi:hypothetical protein
MVVCPRWLDGWYWVLGGWLVSGMYVQGAGSNLLRARCVVAGVSCRVLGGCWVVAAVFLMLRVRWWDQRGGWSLVAAEWWAVLRWWVVPGTWCIVAPCRWMPACSCSVVGHCSHVECRPVAGCCLERELLDSMTGPLSPAQRRSQRNSEIFTASKAFLDTHASTHLLHVAAVQLQHSRGSATA